MKKRKRRSGTESRAWNRFFLLSLLCIALALIVGGLYFLWEDFPEAETGIGKTGADTPAETGGTEEEDLPSAGDEAAWFDMVFPGEEGEGTETSEENPSGVKDRIEAGLEQAEGKALPGDTGYIFIGDSRFVGMNDVCGISDQDNCFVVAKIGEGYRWFTKSALNQADRIIRTGLFENWKLLICLGINDLENVERYMERYRELREKYDIILISVNPVGSGIRITNSQVEYFNGRISETGLPYVDTYRILKESGYQTGDGLHYNGGTYRKIYGGILIGTANLLQVPLVEAGSFSLDDSARSRKNALQREIRQENTVAAPAVPDPVSEEGETGEISGEESAVPDQTGEGSPGEGEAPVFGGDGSGDPGGGAGTSVPDHPEEETGTTGREAQGDDPGTDSDGGDREETDPPENAADDGSSDNGGGSSEGSPGPGYIYISGQWMNDEMMRNYGLTPEQIEQLKRDGHL